MDHENQINEYKFNLTNPQYVNLQENVNSSGENRRYSKQVDDGSRRARTSQLGKSKFETVICIGSTNGKSRLTSGSSKGRNGRRSEKDNFDENPYTTGIENNTQLAINEEDESSLINITTKENLNKTDTGMLCLSKL